jgi:hypothetical protein
MRRFVIPFVIVLALAIPALAMARSGTTFRAQLHELNGSGATGTAWVTVNGDTLTVRIQASWLVPNMGHLRHIHGKLDNLSNAGGSPIALSKCPTPRADADGDGIVSVAEGIPDYGQVALNLGNFMTSTGSIDDTLTFTLGQLGDPSLPLDKRAIVLHGMFGPDGLYDASIPVVCGQLHPQG